MPGRLTERVAVYEFTDAVESAVRSNPETSVIIALIGVVVLVGVYVLVRWLRRPMGVRLRRALESPRDVAVVMHPNPDPDAMASAVGVAHIAESVGTPATLYFSGQIRHQENRAFQTVLDLDFESLEHASEITEDAVILVDHNRARGFQGSESLEPYAVIDHHPGTGSGSAFTDVREEYGACASIVAEYFDELSAVVSSIDPDRQSDGEVDLVLTPSVATGLLYGIQADTKNLTKGCTEAEFARSAYLYPAADEDLLDRIANPQVSAEVLDVKAGAITRREVHGSFAISDVGEVTDVDAIPQAADELMHLEGVTAVVVYGEREGTIHFSGRSRDDRVHMGKSLEAALDSIPLASAGGHARMGGGQVPIEYMAGIGPGISGSTLSTDDLPDRLFDALNGDV